MTLEQTLIDQELAQFGWVESGAFNSISDFKSPKTNVEEQIIKKNVSDFIDTFLCHLIFYMVFCYSLSYYVVIDLGLGSFIRNKVTTLIKFLMKA
mgnify:CR=1 FL=1|tara:strand:+ start:1371 stop:1655 length:285 start_codon:yes stop_codon:yes gene_type:complete